MKFNFFQKKIALGGVSLTNPNINISIRVSERERERERENDDLPNKIFTENALTEQVESEQFLKYKVCLAEMSTSVMTIS